MWGMRQHCDSLERGNKLLEQLNALSGYVRGTDGNGDSRDVPTGVSQIRDEADLHWVQYADNDDGYRRGCSLSGQRAGRRSSQDDIHLRSHQLLRESR